MEMISERLVPAPQQAVWAALNAPESLRECIAGCDKLALAGENEYDVGMAIKIGPVAARFKGRMTLKDIVAPDSYAITFEGQGGMAGFAKGTASVKLVAPAEGEGTLLRYEVHAQVGGKLAQLGARLIDSSAKKMADDFFARFVRIFDPAADAPADADAASASAGSGAGAAAGDATSDNKPDAKPGAVRSMWSRMKR